MVRNRAVVAAPNVVVALFGDNAKIGSETVDLAGGETRTLHFSWQPKAEGAAQLTLRVDPDQALAEMDRRDNQMSVDVVVAKKPADGLCSQPQTNEKRRSETCASNKLSDYPCTKHA
jgi:subtilase family serine protease